MLFLLTLAIYIEHGMGQTQRGRVSSSYSLQVASFCYKTSASAGKVVLDGFLTHNSSTSLCDCTLTTTHSTNISFTALNGLQPGYTNCGSSITVAYGESSCTINCFVLGKVSLSPTQSATLSFEKPGFAYDSSYCMVLIPDNSDPVLTLKCNGNPNFPIISPTITSSMTKTSAVSTSTRTTITTEQFLASFGSTNVNISTTSAGTGVFLVTSETSTLVPNTSNLWIYTIPAIGASMILTFVIILVVCYYERKIRKGKSNKKTYLYDSLGYNINLPYIRDHDEGSDRNYSNLSDVTGIYATIEENARNDGSNSIHTMERTVSPPGGYVQQVQDVSENTYKNTYTNYPRSDEMIVE